jgi:hypothetical protein
MLTQENVQYFYSYQAFLTLMQGATKVEMRFTSLTSGRNMGVLDLRGVLV